MSSSDSQWLSQTADAGETIIIFGPTGNVGSIVTSYIHSILKDSNSVVDSRIVLAMREPSKPIPGLSTSHTFERVKADLADPESILRAIKLTGATRAFIYCIFSANNGSKECLLAMREAGIQFVVFLSSFSVYGPLEDIPREEIIPYLHAAVERNLEEVFPDSYVSLRPGLFATNVFSWRDEIATGVVRLFRPELRMDWVCDVDIGEIAARLLCKGQRLNNEKIVFLLGPQMLSQADAVGTIGRTLGRDVKVESINFEEAVQKYVDSGMSESTARSLVQHFQDGGAEKLSEGMIEQASGNVRRYTGREAIPFEQWCMQNKDRLT